MALNKESGTANLHALYGLNHLGTNALPDLALVLKHLKSTNYAGDIPIRYAAIETLGHLEGGADQSMPALLNLLNDSDPDIRGVAIQSLGSLGTQAIQVVPAITLAFADPSFAVRWRATNALRIIAPEQFPTPR